MEWLFYALDRVGITQEGIAEPGEREQKSYTLDLPPIKRKVVDLTPPLSSVYFHPDGKVLTAVSCFPVSTASSTWSRPLFSLNTSLPVRHFLLNPDSLKSTSGVEGSKNDM